jgi:hypothetical protein
MRKAAPIPSRDELHAAVRILFEGPDAEAVIEILERYEAWRWKESRERVQMAVLVLSKGTLDGVRKYVAEANGDYRNLLLWSEYTKPGLVLRDEVEHRLAAAGQTPWAAVM